MQRAMPQEMTAAVAYSHHMYDFDAIKRPIIITGMILLLLKTTWTGKETNFSALYWHHDEIMLEKAGSEKRRNGERGGRCC